MRATRINTSGNVYAWRVCAWSEIRRLGTFTVEAVEKKCDAHHRAVVDYVIGLTRAGYVQQLADGQFRLVRDTGAEAPMLRRDGQELNDTRGREALWRTMKMLDTFTAQELSLHASTEECPVSERSANYYLTALRQAGYLAPAGRAAGRRARFKLLRSRAKALPPLVQVVTQVYDPNENKVVWQAGQVGGDA
jgi:hypothetical protein